MPRIPSSLPRALYASLRSTTPARLTPTTTPTPTYLSHATRLSGLSLPFAFFSSSSSDKMSDPQPKVQKSESEWKAILSPEQFRILRQKGTEYAGSHPYDKKSAQDQGTYHCAGCDAPLYTSKTKFKSGCGWPAFYDTIPGAVIRKEDKSMFMNRIEILCANCGGHLGHVFKGEGFDTPTDERHCVNGISLNFKEDENK
ncbi:Mss4-like protein [Papiliotrema laurentii]|uniref:Peptide-methionine (R)-S-oxide reductase n=1 Tax=Papiliotrema laurentii TaxID=5418 RepID=A0AAD9L6I6_PAPLA|nr:Mss4-like protein [Papiliotrema laurentii]